MLCCEKILTFHVTLCLPAEESWLIFDNAVPVWFNEQLRISVLLSLRLREIFVFSPHLIWQLYTQTQPHQSSRITQKRLRECLLGVRHCAAEHQMYSERSESYDAPFIKLPAITVPWQKKPASPRPHTQTSALALKGHYALTQQEGKSIKRDRYKKQANISNKHWFTCTYKSVQSVVNSLEVASLP